MSSATIEKHYSDVWKVNGTIMIYKSNTFQYNSSVIITELDNCLIKPITKNKLYNTMNPHDIELASLDFIRKIRLESQDKSIVILSNQVSSDKLIIDCVKRKLECAAEKLAIPLLAIFATIPNKFMKPHTGMWKLLKLYYEKMGNSSIRSVTVVSDEGGQITNREVKGKQYSVVKCTDVDRAFAHNIAAQFKTISEFTKASVNVAFKFDSNIIEPSVRELYANEIDKYENESIFKVLKSFGLRESYVIMIMGAPRSGKTRMANKILEIWGKSDLQINHRCILLSNNDMSEKKRIGQFTKLLNDRCSVVLDGNCHTDELREPYLTALEGKNIPVIYLDVYVGIKMSKVFNHVCVEEAHSTDVTLYKKAAYDIYNSITTIPAVDANKYYIRYMPKIERRETVMYYRY